MTPRGGLTPYGFAEACLNGNACAAFCIAKHGSNRLKY